MANAVVAHWKALVKEVQLVINFEWQDVPAADVAEAVRHFVKSMGGHPPRGAPLPHAAWKKLVQDVQVCEAC
jgi:hypothetical protein